MSTRPATPQCSGRAPAGRPEEAGGVAVVHHHQRVVALGQVADLGRAARRRRPSRTRRRWRSAGSARPRLAFRQPLELVHVAVGVAVALGPAEPDAVDDRGVVERVGDDGVLLAEERLEEPAVGVEAGGVEDRVLRAEEARDRPPRAPCGSSWVPQMNRTLASPRPQRARPSWAARTSVGIVGQPEVVVGAEIEDLAPGHRRPCAPCGPSTTRSPFHSPASRISVELGLQPLPDLTVHVVLPGQRGA